MDADHWWSVDRSERPSWKELLAWEPPSSPSLRGKRGNDSSNHQSALYKIVRGSIDTVIPAKQHTIRIMLSSTFQDYSQERNFLLKDVLPYLKEFGGKFGIDVWLSEMRWGISDEAVRLNRTTEICLKEVERCRKESIGHYFCLMLGNRYGYRPPPTLLSIEEYDRVIQINAHNEDGEQDGGQDGPRIVELLKKYYHLDENLVPPAYVFLRDLGKVHEQISVATNTTAPWIEFIKSWIPFSNEMKAEMPARNVDDDTFWNEEQILSNFFDVPSITEREAIAGLLGDEAKALGSSQRALVYHRNILDVDDKYYRSYSDTDQRTQGWETRLEKMTSLKERTRAYMKENGGHFRHFEVDSIDNMQHYLNDFGDDFCLAVVKKIQDVVLCRRKGHCRQDQVFDLPILQEISQHHNHAKQLFVGREVIVSKLVDHCKSGSGAFVIYGNSGCGKTCILAQVARLMQDHIKNEDQTLVLRFLGISPGKSATYILGCLQLT